MFWYQFPIIKDELTGFENYLINCLESQQPLIEEAISHLVQAGGKRIRPALIMISAHFGNYNQDRVWNVAAAIEMLHMATLIHDDIIDEAELRRGKETAQSKFGKDTAVFTGDYLFSLTFNVLSGKAETDQLKEVSRVVQKICEGEIQQHENRYKLSISYKKYFKRIRGKTALLFEGSCALGAKLGGLNKLQIRRLAHYGRYLGMAFQLTDDVLDFTSPAEKLGKPGTNDFTQGIYTLPMLYAIKETDKSSKLQKLLKNPVENCEQIKDLVVESGGTQYALNIAEDYIKKARKKLEKLPDNNYCNVLIELTEKVLERNY